MADLLTAPAPSQDRSNQAPAMPGRNDSQFPKASSMVSTDGGAKQDQNVPPAYRVQDSSNLAPANKSNFDRLEKVIDELDKNGFFKVNLPVKGSARGVMVENQRGDRIETIEMTFKPVGGGREIKVLITNDIVQLDPKDKVKAGKAFKDAQQETSKAEKLAGAENGQEATRTEAPYKLNKDGISKLIPYSPEKADQLKKAFKRVEEKGDFGSVKPDYDSLRPVMVEDEKGNVIQAMEMKFKKGKQEVTVLLTKKMGTLFGRPREAVKDIMNEALKLTQEGKNGG